MIPGIDTSHWEGKIDWSMVARAGYEFTFTKATEGITYVDDTLQANISGSRAAGLFCAPYHFYRTAYAPGEQADLFLRSIDKLQYSLPPVLDFEDKHDRPTREIAANLLTWLNRVESATGKKPIVYSSAYYWNTFAGSPTWSVEYNLWVANYTTAAQPLKPRPWTKWLFWQWADNAAVPGVPGECDVNWFNGTQEDLYRLAGVEYKPPTTLDDILKKLDHVIGILESGKE